MSRGGRYKDDSWEAWEAHILTWVVRDYEERKRDSELCSYELRRHEREFRVRIKRLYREAADATGLARVEPLRELVRYLCDCFLDGDFLVGKKRNGSWRTEPIADERLLPLLMFGGMRDEAVARQVLTSNDRGRNDRIRDCLRKVRATLADTDPAIEWDALTKLVRAMLAADHVPARRNRCEILLERHEDYLLATGTLDGMDKAAVTEWLQTDKFYKLFDRVTSDMLVPFGLEEGEKPDVYLEKFYYAGYRRSGDAIDREKHAVHLRELFCDDFDYLVSALLLSEAEDELNNLGVTHARPGGGDSLQEGHLSLEGGLQRKEVPTELVHRYHMAHQQSGFSDEGLREEALALYRSVLADPPDPKRGVWVPLAPSTPVSDAQVEVPVSLYLMDANRAKILGKGRFEVGGPATLVVFAFVALDTEDMDSVMRMQPVRDGSLYAMAMALRLLPVAETLDKWLPPKGKPTDTALAHAVGELLKLRRAMAREYRKRLQNANDLAPRDYSDRKGRYLDFFGG